MTLSQEVHQILYGKINYQKEFKAFQKRCKKTQQDLTPF